MKPWTVLSSRWVLRRPWASIRLEQVQTARGAILEDYPLVTTRDWVCVVCLTEARELVCVRQYRHGVQRVTLELPAGGMDDGEEPLAAARRELAEETGFQAETWHVLGAIFPETTRHQHRAHLFLALDARRTQMQSLDPGEDVEVVLRAPQGGLRKQLDHAVHQLALMLAKEEYPLWFEHG